LLHDRPLVSNIHSPSIPKAAALSLMLLATALGAGACDGESGQPIGIRPPDGAGGDGGAAAVNDQGEQMFRALETEFVSACGACHTTGNGDTPFLGSPEDSNPEPYQTITSWSGIIVKKAPASVLLSWPASGVHTGGAIETKLEAKLFAWLDEEAKAVADVTDDAKPTTAPFKPVMGFNAVYFDSIDKKFEGMALTFKAQEITPETLSLTNLQIHPTHKLGVAIKHPLFSFFAQGSNQVEPDPIDSFSNVDATFEAGESAALGPGSLLLTNWRTGGKLSVAFDTLDVVEPFDPGAGGGGPVSGCVDPQAFNDNARGPLQNNCAGCHGGGNTTASNAVDMSSLDDDPEASCAQLHNRVNFDNPAQSQLFITTDPGGNATHPFKFGGNAGAFNNFVDAVTAWIEKEGA
jgi:cytochrome c553